MDKTLISENSATLYRKYERSRGESTWLDQVQLYFWLLQYSFGWINAERTAERVLSQYTGLTHTELTHRCADWYPKYVRQHISSEARAAVERHRRAGDYLVIVTASTRYASAPLAAELAFDSIVATELELGMEGRLTGAYLKPLCYGVGKVERVTALLQQQGLSLEDAAFYTDSATDLPLLEAVKEPFAVNPDLRLKRIARERGYPILRW